MHEYGRMAVLGCWRGRGYDVRWGEVRRKAIVERQIISEGGQ